MEGYIKRTAQGRVALPNAYRKLGLKPPVGPQSELFGSDKKCATAELRTASHECGDRFFPNVAKVLTVAELTRPSAASLETKFGAVWVQGEISNYKMHPSGHQYFTLKDQRAAIACVIFRDTLPPFPNALTDGTQVQVYGNVSVFEARGQYQLNVQILQSRGLGLLQAKFEALKRKLEAEGLFDPARKRAAPDVPESHRHHYFTERRGHSRYPQRSAPARSGRRRADQSGARPGRRRCARDRDRDP